MKRIIALVIAIVVAAGVSGCAKTANQQITAQDNTQQKQGWQITSKNTQEAKHSDKAFPRFETIDLDGNKATSEIFSKSKLTIVTLWATT